LIVLLQHLLHLLPQSLVVLPAAVVEPALQASIEILQEFAEA
jgi:hypothetical protein